MDPSPNRRLFLAALVGLPVSSVAKEGKAVVVAFDPDDLIEFRQQPDRIKTLIRFASDLTRRKLGYLYGSNDPRRGGMDCSGTIHHTLSKMDIEAPRSSHAQYIWVKEAKTLRELPDRASALTDPVFRDLRPGDLVFWEGTYETGDRLPPISHAMIYLGTSVNDLKPVLFGASSGRRFRGQRIHGVSVFDFELPGPRSASRVVGYGAVPGLR